MGDLLVAAGLFVAAFLLGSIPFGLIISKVFYHTDLREHGSGNNTPPRHPHDGQQLRRVRSGLRRLLSYVSGLERSACSSCQAAAFEPGAGHGHDTMLAAWFLAAMWGVFCRG